MQKGTLIIWEYTEGYNFYLGYASTIRVRVHGLQNSDAGINQCQLIRVGFLIKLDPRNSDAGIYQRPHIIIK
jgi:hypothetical protein